MNILKQAPTRHEDSKFKIALVSGLSNPNSCRLTPSQKALICLPNIDKRAVIDWNFPFIPDSPTVPDNHEAGRVPLLRACLANGSQFFQSLTKRYQKLASPHWESLLQSTEHLLLVTGSCGLQLLNSWHRISDYSDRIQVLALGPVTLSRTIVATTLLQGSRDNLSRICFRRVDRKVINVGHMDYWHHPHVKEIVTQWLQDRISAL